MLMVKLGAAAGWTCKRSVWHVVNSGMAVLEDGTVVTSLANAARFKSGGMLCVASAR